MIRKVCTVLVLSAMLMFTCDLTASAGAPTERVRSMLDSIMATQTNPQLQGEHHREERREVIRKIIADNFDLDAMAKTTLGQHWDKLSKPRRTEFASIFTDLFLNSYTSLVLNFLHREQVEYTKEDADRLSARVRTKIIRTNEEIPVDYSLESVKGTWLVNDVSVDGVSVVDNYQKSFARVIQRESFDGLLKRMKIQQEAAQ